MITLPFPAGNARGLLGCAGSLFLYKKTNVTTTSTNTSLLMDIVLFLNSSTAMKKISLRFTESCATEARNAA
jgi:hypothetical protein